MECLKLSVDSCRRVEGISLASFEPLFQLWGVLVSVESLETIQGRDGRSLGKSSDDLVDLLLGSLASSLEGDLLVSDPSVLLLEGVLLDETWTGSDNGSGDLAILGLWTVWVSSDSLVGSSVDIFEALSLEDLGPSGELLVEGSLILFLQLVEVLLDVDSEDVLSVLINAEHFLSLTGFLGLSSSLIGLGLSLLDTESWESLLRVRDVESSIAGTLHGSEDTVSSGGAHETNIKEGLEWALLLTTLSNVVVGSIDLAVSSELSVQSLKLKESSGA